MNGTSLCVSYLTVDTSCTSSHWIPTEVYEISIQFSSVAQSCLTLCDPMNCSTPGFPVHHQLLELAQIHVHRTGDAIQNLIFCYLLLLPPSNIPSIRVFSNESVLHIRWPKYWSFSFSISPSNEYSDWFPLGLTGLISLLSKGLSRVFSSTTVQSINSLAFSFLCRPTLTSIQDHWKNHSFDKTDLCWQSNVSAS